MEDLSTVPSFEPPSFEPSSFESGAGGKPLPEVGGRSFESSLSFEFDSGMSGAIEPYEMQRFLKSSGASQRPVDRARPRMSPEILVANARDDEAEMKRVAAQHQTAKAANRAAKAAFAIYRRIDRTEVRVIFEIQNSCIFEIPEAELLQLDLPHECRRVLWDVRTATSRGAMPVAAEKLQNPEWGPAEHTNALRFARADLKILDLLPDELSQFRLTPADIAAPFGLDPEDRGN